MDTDSIESSKLVAWKDISKRVLESINKYEEEKVPQ